MKQIYIFILALITVFSACVHKGENKELKRSYEVTIEVLSNSINDNGNHIRYAYLIAPSRMHDYYSRWQKIDSLVEDIEHFLRDSSSQMTGSDFYTDRVKKVKDIQQSSSALIGGHFNEKVGHLLKYPESGEISNSEFPKLLAAFTLLYDLDKLTREIRNSISLHNENWGGFSLEVDGNRKADSTEIVIHSADIDDFTREGYFEIDKLIDSKGRVVKQFESKPDIALWRLKFSGNLDNTYYISCSLYLKSPSTGTMKKIKTFENEKVKITANNK